MCTQSVAYYHPEEERCLTRLTLIGSQKWLRHLFLWRHCLVRNELAHTKLTTWTCWRWTATYIPPMAQKTKLKGEHYTVDLIDQTAITWFCFKFATCKSIPINEYIWNSWVYKSVMRNQFHRSLFDVVFPLLTPQYVVPLALIRQLRIVD